MSNSALVSFKIEPDHYTVLKAMATSKEQSLSQFVRETIVQALELDHYARMLGDYFQQVAKAFDG